MFLLEFYIRRQSFAPRCITYLDLYNHIIQKYEQHLSFFLLLLCVCVHLRMYLHSLFRETLKGAICFSISPRHSRDF